MARININIGLDEISKQKLTDATAAAEKLRHSFGDAKSKLDILVDDLNNFQEIMSEMELKICNLNKTKRRNAATKD